MTVVLDTSALVSLFVFDAHSATMRRRSAELAERAGVSTFAAAEFASAIGRRLRAGEFDLTNARRALGVFDTWCGLHASMLDVAPEDHREAAHYVRRFDLGLRAPDALHIAICRRLDAALLTFDARQAAAAVCLGIACDPAGATG